MELRQLGNSVQRVSALGLGLMGMSDFYGPADEHESLATIREALERGITYLDTGDFYGMGHNERLLQQALEGHRRENAFIAVKFGALRDPGGAFLGIDTRPASLKNFLAYSLRRLGTDYVDLYQPARIDPAVPIEDTVGAIAELVKAGYVRYVGLSEAAAETLERAQRVHPIAALQIEYSLMSRGIEREILPTARRLGIATVAYGVLSRGLLSGKVPEGGQRDFRTAFSPRFQGENLSRNLELVRRLGELAQAKGASTTQLAIAWVLAQGEDVIPLVGARRRASLQEALQAAELRLSGEDLVAMESAVPAGAVAGTRYDASQMTWLDSERQSGKAQAG